MKNDDLEVCLLRACLAVFEKRNQAELYTYKRNGKKGQVREDWDAVNKQIRRGEGWRVAVLA